MNENLNKASICSIVTMEVIDFAKKKEADQVEIKTLLYGLLAQAVIDIPQDDRMILQKEHGAVVVCNGPLENALEDALMISLSVRDEILKSNAQHLKPCYVQFGISLGSVKLASKKGQPALVGEGVDEAQRIMSFANPNQILVSRGYHDMASKVSQDVSNMFEQYDMHAHEQEIYAVLLKAAQVEPLANVDASPPQNWLSEINWRYAIAGCLVLAVLVGLAKQVFAPAVPRITMDAPVVEQATAQQEVKPTAEPTPSPAPVAVAAPDEPVSPAIKAEKMPIKPTKTVQKKAKQVLKGQATASHKEQATETHTTTTATEKSTESKQTENKTAEAKTAKSTSKSGSAWDSFTTSIKTGTERPCSQAETAMGQCTK